MENKQIILALCAVFAFCMVPIGFLVGEHRYRKYGKQIKEKVEEEYRQAQEKGGTASLYYKRTDKRIFKQTFGLPVLIGFVVGLISLLIIFSLL